MRDLVGQHLLARRRLGREPSGAEEDVPTGGERLGTHRRAELTGLGAVVHPHVTERRAERGLHAPPDLLRHRRTAAAGRLDPAGRGVVQGATLGAHRRAGGGRGRPAQVTAARGVRVGSDAGAGQPVQRVVGHAVRRVLGRVVSVAHREARDGDRRGHRRRGGCRRGRRLRDRADLGDRGDGNARVVAAHTDLRTSGHSARHHSRVPGRARSVIRSRYAGWSPVQRASPVRRPSLAISRTVAARTSRMPTGRCSATAS